MLSISQHLHPLTQLGLEVLKVPSSWKWKVSESKVVSEFWYFQLLKRYQGIIVINYLLSISHFNLNLHPLKCFGFGGQDVKIGVFGGGESIFWGLGSLRSKEDDFSTVFLTIGLILTDFDVWGVKIGVFGCGESIFGGLRSLRSKEGDFSAFFLTIGPKQKWKTAKIRKYG